MIVTEKEARDIACPFAKDFNGLIRGNNYFPETIKSGGSCGGSQCMAWDFIDSEMETKRIQIPVAERITVQPTREELTKLLNDQEPGWTLAQYPNAQDSSVYHPPIEEQRAAWQKVHGFSQPAMSGFHDSLTRSFAITINVERVRAERRGECKRAVYPSDNS